MTWYRVEDFVALSAYGARALARAIYYALAQPVNSNIGVITISLGLYAFYPSKTESDNLVINALARARAQGVIVCAAAGQIPNAPEFVSKRLEPVLPGRDENAIGCAGCRPDSAQSPMASGFLGQGVDITAPAQDVWVPDTLVFAPEVDAIDHERSTIYGVRQSLGTSYATAFVAGACALWQAHHGREWLLDPTNYGPELIFPLFKHALQCSAYKPPGWDASKRGAGVLDAEKLLAFPLPSKDEIANQSLECPDF